MNCISRPLAIASRRPLPPLTAGLRARPLSSSASPAASASAATKIHPLIANPTHSIASLLTPPTRSHPGTSHNDPPTSLDLNQVCTLAGLPYPSNPTQVESDLSQFLTLVNHLHDAQAPVTEPLASVSLCSSVSLQDLLARQVKVEQPRRVTVAKEVGGGGEWMPRVQDETAGFDDQSGLYVVPVQVVAKPGKPSSSETVAGRGAEDGL